MKASGISNYEITKNSMEEKFLTYNQAKMIDKFRLKTDEQYLYLRLVDQEYRVNRFTGRVEYDVDGDGRFINAGYDASMTIYDVLCSSGPEAHLSGRFVGLNALKGLVVASAPGPELFTEDAAFFAGRCPQLKKACEQLGGTEENPGDVAYRISLFDFMQVIVQFWDADEEFDAVFRVLWDENILDYMHYETTFYATSYLLERLKILSGCTDAEPRKKR